MPKLKPKFPLSLAKMYETAAAIMKPTGAKKTVSKRPKARTGRRAARG
jgi:hypothetical protein